MRWVQKQLGLCWEGAAGRLQGTAGGQLSLCPVGSAGRAGLWQWSLVGKLRREPALEAGLAGLGLKGWWLVDAPAGGWAAGTGLRVGLSSSVWGWLDSGIRWGRRFCLAGTNVGMLRSALCSQQALALLQTDGRSRGWVGVTAHQGTGASGEDSLHKARYPEIAELATKAVNVCGFTGLRIPDVSPSV